MICNYRLMQSKLSLKTMDFANSIKNQLQGVHSTVANVKALTDLEDAIRCIAIPDEMRFATINNPYSSEGGPLNPYNIRIWACLSGGWSIDSLTVLAELYKLFIMQI